MSIRKTLLKLFNRLNNKQYQLRIFQFSLMDVAKKQKSFALPKKLITEALKRIEGAVLSEIKQF